MSEDEVMAEVNSFSFFVCSDLCPDVVIYTDESSYSRWLRDHIWFVPYAVFPLSSN